MKRFIMLIIGVVFFFIAHSQSCFHYYFSQTTADYIQVGYGQNYILFSSGSNSQFVRLNYVGTEGSFMYYGDDSFQVAITNDCSQACICTAQYVNCYNYCAPVPIPNPYPYMQSNNSRSQAVTSSKCPWCNGSGRITKNDHVPQYGLNDYSIEVKCGECGFTYNKTYTNHYHLNCGHCGGTGRLSN